MAAGVLALAVALLPAYVAVAFSVGSKPLELGGLFSSVAILCGALGWLDQTRDRVPLRDAVRLLTPPGRPAVGGS
jgi:hypothetical protein